LGGVLSIGNDRYEPVALAGNGKWQEVDFDELDAIGGSKPQLVLTVAR